jgi:predicted HTH domain antitoxin
MDNVTLQITLPKQVLLSLGLTSEDAERAFWKFLILQLVRDAQISTGKAAEMLGLSKYQVVQLMAGEGIPYFNYSKEELEEELKNIDEWLSTHHDR